MGWLVTCADGDGFDAFWLSLGCVVCSYVFLMLVAAKISSQYLKAQERSAS